jgi:hypothetical protein
MSSSDAGDDDSQDSNKRKNTSSDNTVTKTPKLTEQTQEEEQEEVEVPPQEIPLKKPPKIPINAKATPDESREVLQTSSIIDLTDDASDTSDQLTDDDASVSASVNINGNMPPFDGDIEELGETFKLIEETRATGTCKASKNTQDRQIHDIETMVHNQPVPSSIFDTPVKPPRSQDSQDSQDSQSSILERFYQEMNG